MTNPGTPQGNISRARIFFLAAFALLVLTIAVPPFVNINRFRHSIVQSISAGLDRPVYANAVELTLFPRPAFVLHHLTVAEWPPYGAEPVITAETVTASLRASTFWHRRVEIASLHFDAPSVNLVRDSNGQWNIESLISNSPALRAPGTSSTASPPPFPYVEATDARINFKRGAEKLPLSLEGAQLAFWKESGNEWHVRIKARPVRTDLPPGDAGQLLGEASLKTNGALMDSPVRATLEWRRGQLGEISRLLQGKDSGWRGTVDLTANVRGTVAKALVTSDVQVEEFRRAEFVPPSEINLTAHCTGQYAHGDWSMGRMNCDAPIGGGHLLVKSMIGNRDSSGNQRKSSEPQSSQSDDAEFFQTTVQHVSAAFFLDLLRHIHPGVAADTTATGEVNGDVNCEWRGMDTLRACSGELRSTPLTVHLPNLDSALHISPLLISTGEVAESLMKTAAVRVPVRKADRIVRKPASESVPGVWNLAATRVSMSTATSATLAGKLTSSGLMLDIGGPADLRDLSRLARAMNSPVTSSGVHSIRGAAQMDLTLRSNWLPQSNAAAFVRVVPSSASNLQSVAWFVPSQWGGSVQIHNATLRLGSFPGIIQITGAQVNLTDTGVEWTGLTGTFARIPFDGSIGWATSCPTTRPPCERTFALHSANVNVDRLQGVLRRSVAESGLLAQLNPWAAGVPELPEISGTFKADTLSAGKLVLKNASLGLHLHGHEADLSSIDGKLFGGTLSGSAKPVSGALASDNKTTESAPENSSGLANLIEPNAGTAQWGDGAPIYTLGVMLESIQPDMVAAIWHEKWGRGTATVRIRMKTRGWSTTDLAQNAKGSFAIDWRNGSLAASMPPATSAVGDDFPAASSAVPGFTRFQRLRAMGEFGDEKMMLTSGQLLLTNQSEHRQTMNHESQALSGAVTFSRELDLKMQPSGLSITGPLSSPILKSEGVKAVGVVAPPNP